MSGTTTNPAAKYSASILDAEYGSQIFTGLRGEYGNYKFADPHRQATYEHHEMNFRRMQMLKIAYDKQEFLRRMRTDLKREYLTRKKQVKRLQMDAAVNFRNAENELQEHYAGMNASEHQPYIHGVDINAPLVSQIQLPHDEILDLKTFDEQREFEKLRQIHTDLFIDQQESIRLWEQQEQRQREWEATNDAAWVECQRQQYRQRLPYEPRGKEEEDNAQKHWECEDANCSTCGHDDDQSSYDSEYCAEFGDYPREYNCERECREREEAAQAEAAQAEAVHAEAGHAEAAAQQRWEENTRDSDEDGLWDEEAIQNEAEHRREVALMKLNDDMTYACDDHPDVQQLDVVSVTEPRERITTSSASSGGISAQKKAAAGAAKKAAKARQAKQDLKKKAKFVPFKITMNTNRVPVHKECRDVEEWSDAEDVEEEQSTTTTTLLYQGRAQINLPKKNLQNVSREAKERHIAKWRRIEATEKHASARGTRIANISEPRSWHNCGGSDCD
jgi:hypothetical protein